METAHHPVDHEKIKHDNSALSYPLLQKDNLVKNTMTFIVKRINRRDEKRVKNGSILSISKRDKTQ